MDTGKVIITLRADSVRPYLHGIWCRLGEGKPFVNDVVHKAWTERGSVVLGLETHNRLPFAAAELVEVVELDVPHESLRVHLDAKEAAFQATRPTAGACVAGTAHVATCSEVP